MASQNIRIDRHGYAEIVPVGYWRRGTHQYWHIKEDSALCLNDARPDYHYNGDGNFIFFSADSCDRSVIMMHKGREAITKEEFEAEREKVTKRIQSF